MRTKFSKISFLILIFAFIGCNSQKEMNKINLAELSITEIHKAYAQGNYNSQQLVSTYIDRIKKYNAELNAITLINPEAIIIAKALDEEYEKTRKLRPLHGIPLIVKDNFNTKGLYTTGGSLALKDFIPEENAFIIEKLVDAGAIIIAKSNMAEWAFSPMHTESSTAGTTHNPYNINYVPAGSSGGTAAAVAANLGTIGVGTDTGNSVRGPSSHCSLVGFRSTIGLISREGIIPLSLRNDMAGPMCRSVEDATRVLEVIAAYDANDAVTKYSDGKIPANYQQFLQKDGLNESRIGVLRELSDNDPDPEITALFEQALEDMEALGATIIDTIEIPDFSNLRKNQWCADFRKDIENYLAKYVKRDSLRTLEDIISIGTKSDFAAQRLTNLTKNSGRSVNPEIECSDPYTDSKRIAYREAIEKKMDELNLDAIVYPSWNNKPARIDSFQSDYKGDNSQVIAPHTGQPAFTVPMGFTSGNLPAGLQFLGRMYAEPTLIKICYGYEQGTNHRKAALVD